MNSHDEAYYFKRKNVIDMAITFSAMNRVFKKGSKKKIASKLEESLNRLEKVQNKDSFKKVHLEFCKWFTKNISTAEKQLKNKKSKNSQPATYGQAAKIFDIAAKIYVYYCHLPTCGLANQLIKFLHGAIDTPILKNLKARYRDSNIVAETIEAIDEIQYFTLQELVIRHIQDEFNNLILPVQYDDIMWHRLNRST